IALIPSYGVTDQTLLEACTLLDMEGKLYKFPNGIRTVLERMNKELIEHITSTYGDIDTSKVPRIRDKILCLQEICVRYHASLPEPKALLKSLANYYLTPSNTCFAMSMVFKIADTMWYLTKDPSTDFNYYTKRITLATISLLSMLHMSDDTSENFTTTFDFLNRREENIISFYKKKSKKNTI
ncbi:MAG: COQ9 family protein, partial [Anaplasma sp.]|nr:COQ9 family protein [Anaplasma sp.]